MRNAVEIPEVGLVDVDVDGERRLEETVEGAGFRVFDAGSLDELAQLAKARELRTLVIAFEALWPQPQAQLRRMREAVPNARILVAYSQKSPRHRLGKRLWAIGLIDQFFSRAVAPHELAGLVREGAASWAPAAASDDLASELIGSEALVEVTQALLEISSVLAGPRTIEGLLRAFHIKLSSVVSPSVLHVLTIDPLGPRGRLYAYLSRPVAHELSRSLTEQMCQEIAPWLEEPLRPDDLVFIENPVGSETSVDEASGAPSSLSLRLQSQGDVLGCLGMHTDHPLSDEQRVLMHILAPQLATALRGAQAREWAEAASLIDELTKAYNRRYLSRVLPAEWRRARRYGGQLSVAMLDLDHFKQLNDRWGHLVGDVALQQLVRLARDTVRDTDHVVRYGGEEFVLILPETGASEAAMIVERLRTALRSELVDTGTGTSVTMTFSAGIATVPAGPAATPEQLLELADQALLTAKRSGRDRICVSSDLRARPVMTRSDSEQRGFPRIEANLAMRFLPLPLLEGRTLSLEVTDYASGGAGVKAPPGVALKADTHALVQFESGDGPMLAQVVWARSQPSGETIGGLRFLRGAEFGHLLSESVRPVRVSALVVVSSERSRQLAHRVLQAANYQCVIWEGDGEPSLDELCAHSLILLGETELRSSIVGTLTREGAERDAPMPRLILLNEQERRSEAFETIKQSRVEHLVGDIDSDHALFATLTKLVVGDYFGLSKYLMWGVEPRVWSVASAGDKGIVLEGIRSMARQVDCHPRVCDLLVAGVDEMLVNAMYRASTSTQQNNVEVEVASDGRLLGVAVVDHHGQLESRNVYSSLERALGYGASGLPDGAKSMSMGFWIMLNTLSHLAINVDPGVRTEIIGIVDLKKSLREIRQAVPNLGLFSKS